MAGKKVHRLNSIKEFHKLRGLSSPAHPLVSVINLEEISRDENDYSGSIILGYYSITLKRNFNAKIRYGQQEYDFDEGIMFFMAPGQVFSIQPGNQNEAIQPTGWMLLIHPDFLWNTPLATAIKQYDYFDYASNEALFLSESEESRIIDIMHKIYQEYNTNIDRFSQYIIVAQLELLLSYSNRFYNRQFITRKVTNHTIVNRLENILAHYFATDDLMQNGLPTVQYIANELNVSPNYLSGLLKMNTGQSTQQHIHDKLIDVAKHKLSTTNLSVSEIAFTLGFEHPQSFSKLFKAKTSFSPISFRQSYN